MLKDEGFGVADDQLDDKDRVLRMTSVGVAGTSVRSMRATLSAPTTFGIFGINSVSLQGNPSIDSYLGPTYSAASKDTPGASKVGSNGDISLMGSADIQGDALAGGTVSGGPISGATVSGAPAPTYRKVFPNSVARSCGT